MHYDSENDELTQTVLRLVNEKRPKNVKQLTAFMKENLNLKEEEILALVLRMQADGRIKLKNKASETQSFSSYLKTSGAFWYWAILTSEALIASMVFTISENAYPWIYLRNLFGVIFVFFLPGYAFTKALHPINTSIRISTEELEKIQRIALSVGMSLALVSIIGLLLYYSPWGIDLNGTILSLLAFTSFFATIAIIREYRIKKTNFAG